MKSRNSIKNKANDYALASIATAIVMLLAAAGILYGGASVLGFNTSRMEFMHNENYAAITIVVSSLATVLLTYLLSLYIRTYFEMRSGFTMALIVMVVALMLNSLSSNPLLFGRFGYGPINGPFAFLPPLFTLAAATTLLYLNSKWQ